MADVILPTISKPTKTTNKLINVSNTMIDTFKLLYLFTIFTIII